jgi:hypothetical protein
LITHLEHKDIDRAKWDLCLEQSVNSLVYAYSWYLDIVSPNWGALILDDYLAVMPLTGHRKYFISYLSQPFFTQQLGVFSKQNISHDILVEFLEAIPSRFKFIEIQLNEQNQVLDEQFKIKKRKNYVLDLNRNYDKIAKEFNSQTMRNLKRAKKHELSMKSISGKEVVLFYKLHKAVSTKGVREKDYQMLLNLVEMANDKRSLLARGVYDKSGELLAAGVFLVQRNRLIFLLGNGSEMGREKGAMTLLMDSLIMQFSGHKMVLDFEGSEIEGIARFFKSFGAEKRNYYKFRRNNLPWILKIFKS